MSSEPLIPQKGGSGVTNPSRALSNFTRLSPKVWLYTPPTSITTPTHTTKSTPAPTTILLCAWMNALPKHIEYYTRKYTSLYPSARIILVTITTKEFLFQTETTRRADIASAVTALLAPTQDQTQDRLLIHSLSNGGARRVYGIASVYRSLTGKPLPATAWLVDSAPGIPKFRRDVNALMVPARNWGWALWVPYMAAVIVTASLVYVVVNWLPKWVWYELVWGPIEGLNNIKLIQKECVKGFVYSKEDLVIDWRDVEDGARISEERGWKTLKMLVVDAPHVQLFKGRDGEEGYWGFMRKVWQTGL